MKDPLGEAQKHLEMFAKVLANAKEFDLRWSQIELKRLLQEIDNARRNEQLVGYTKDAAGSRSIGTEAS